MTEIGLFSDDMFLPLDRLADRVNRASNILAAAGVTRGSAVALLLRNGPVFIEASMAAQHLGAYAVPINWHFTAPEIAYVLADCAARVLIGDGDLLLEVAASIPPGTRVFATGEQDHAPLASDWESAVATASSHPVAAHEPTESMIYTSGTTGKPKGVRRASATPEQAVEIAAMRKRIYGHAPGMRALLAAPLYHSAPNYFALSTLRVGGSLVLRSRFDAEETLRLIEAHRITHMFMVPTMFVRLLALPQEVRQRFDTSSLRWVLHAGAPCPAHIKLAMIEWWGPVLTEYYGSTELGPLTFCNSVEWLAHRGTVGRPLDGVQFSIRDTAGSICPTGVAGEVCVSRTPQTDFTYHGNTEKRLAMETDMGLASGDIAYVDDDGYLYICDRQTDMVISGGVNIYPAEIEAALMEIGGIADCAVLGVPDPEFGEKVVAFIQLAPDAELTATGIAAMLRGRIAGYKVPRTIHFRSALPRDDSGKIFKRKLRDEMLPLSSRAAGNTNRGFQDAR